MSVLCEEKYYIRASAFNTMLGNFACNNILYIHIKIYSVCVIDCVSLFVYCLYPQILCVPVYDNIM